MQCGPSTFPRFRFFASLLLKKLECADKTEDEQDDDEAVDGVLNFDGENLLVVQEVTVCNRPLCSTSERGVRCSDVDLKAKIKLECNFQRVNCC